MKKIFVLSSQSVLTSKGAVNFLEGQSYQVDDWIANSLAGRGYARLEDGGPAVTDDSVKFENLNVANLRELAKQAGIPGYKKMSKELLIQALYDSRRRVIAEPPAEAFTVLPNTKVSVPEFKLES